MNWIDYGLIAIALAGFLQGARKGWPRTLASIVGLLAGFAAALLWYQAIGDAVLRTLRLPRPWVNTVAFLLLVAAGDVLGVLIGLLLGRPRKRAQVAFRLFGGVVGLVKGGLWAAIVLVILLASPLAEYAGKDVQRSRLAPHLVRGEQWVLGRLISLQPERLAHLSPRLKF